MNTVPAACKLQESFAMIVALEGCESMGDFTFSVACFPYPEDFVSKDLQLFLQVPGWSRASIAKQVLGSRRATHRSLHAQQCQINRLHAKTQTTFLLMSWKASSQKGLIIYTAHVIIS